MKSIKQQFIDFRSTTPKHLQWLLLIAAFIVVLILLTLVIKRTHGKYKETNLIDEKTVEWSFKPSDLEFKSVNVGDTKMETMKIIVTDTVFVEDIKIIDTYGKDWEFTGDCENKIDKSCEMNVIYKPSVPRKKTATNLVITYHLPENQDVTEVKEIPVVFSSNELVKESEQLVMEEPTIVTETPKNKEQVVTVTEAKNNTDVKSEIIENKNDVVALDSVVDKEPANTKLEEEDELTFENLQDEAQEEISIIAPEKPFEQITPTNDMILPSEKCSDFAIPGYNQAGVQIGWIKPTQGANYFHPFSDKDCTKPTGKYDWATGVITSLKDGSRIGTDADHIGYRNTQNRGLSLPSLSAPATTTSLQLKNGHFDDTAVWSVGGEMDIHSQTRDNWQLDFDTYKGSADPTEQVVSSRPYDRTFILRQFKPIPATIVSEVRADPSVYGCSLSDNSCNPSTNTSIPVRATVDRNVYSDDGRTIIIPTGTLLMGYLTGQLPGPYQSFGRMNIKWYQFIRPDGVEFNFPGSETDPYSGDAQGRVGVPGRGSTDYVEQMVIPILTAMVPAAVNMIAPIADTFVNQINLDNNTVVQSGTMRSSEMAKQEIINTWNTITNKLVVDAISNTVPPFSIPAGTRINVYSPVDLVVTCGNSDKSKKCAFEPYPDDKKRRKWADIKQQSPVSVNSKDSSWIGQVRAWNLDPYCVTDKDGKWTIGDNWANNKYGYDYRTILLYCESRNYVSKNMAKNAVYTDQQNEKFTEKYGNVQYDQTGGKVTVTQTGEAEQKKAYNEDILGLKYADDEETILNPFNPNKTPGLTPDVITCDDGAAPDENGCCTGETYTDMGEQGFNCCPDSGGDCFPPIILE